MIFTAQKYLSNLYVLICHHPELNICLVRYTRGDLLFWFIE